MGNTPGWFSAVANFAHRAKTWSTTHPISALAGLGGVATAGTVAAALVVKLTTPVPEPLPPGDPRVAASVVASPQGDPRYQVWYATDRKPLDPSDHSKGYSAEWDQQVHHGICRVAIPKGHRFGSVGLPWWHWRKWWQWVSREADDRLRLVDLSVLPEDSFWNSLRDTLARGDPSERATLVYIHGYNTGFADAAVRAAQVGFDLNVQGATAFFSWSSKGEFEGYLSDAAAIERSEDHIATFLAGIAQRTGAHQVHVIAHSMGNRGLLRALHGTIGKAALAHGVRFGKIFLAAPDVDGEVFARLAEVYPTVSDRTTLYVSGRDKPLWFSRWAHDYPRAGFVPPVTVVTGIDTVEVTNIDVDLLGHGYYAEAAPVLYDMHLLLRGNELPAKRPRLHAAATDQGRRYWILRP